MKGFWRMMESVLAIMILLSFLLTAGSVYFTKSEKTEASSIGYEKLKELDVSNELRQLAANGNYSAINSKIELPGYSHTVLICDFSGACSGAYPDSQNIMVSSYIIAGYDQYSPLEVRLYIW